MATAQPDRLDRLEVSLKQLISSQKLTHVRLDKFDEITGVRQELRDISIKFDAYVKTSDGMTPTATTIIITAGMVALLAPVLRAVAPHVY